MALDLISVSSTLDSRPKKRPRLTWDDPGPSLHDEVCRLPLDLASRLFFAQPAVYSGKDAQCKGAAAGHSSATVAGSGLSLPAVYINGSTRVASPPLRDDDKDGHYNFELGENLTSRYKILSKMGEGTFGRVLECWDRQSREYVAIKVVRSVQKYRDAAMIEIDVLRVLAKNDKIGSRGCLQMRSWFDYRNHICIVCEKLGPSLFDFLRINNYRPFSVDLVREFGRQLLESVAYLHGLNLIHTDLKPENVLLASADHTKVVDDKKTTDHVLQTKRVPKSSRIKVIDFGSATYDSQYNHSVVSTRHYRAPEVILGLGWSYACDIWSVGCILIELCTGEALFQTHENLEHLAMMERVLGPIPSHIIRKSVRRAEKYFRHGELNWPEGSASRESIRAVRRLLRLRNLVMQHVDHSAGLLIDLLQGLLKYEPSERLTAKEALEHPFFRSSSR